jgi:ParB family chromosome partitioning protein
MEDVMQKPQKRLGRGLSSLISATGDAPAAPLPAPLPRPEEPAAEPIEAGTLAEIPLNSIRPNPYQPRKTIRDEELDSLCESIKESGVIQPIIVRKAAEHQYELIAGERRWRASQKAGLAHIPALIRTATDEAMLEIALVENIFRDDLNAMERAAAYQRYCHEFDLTAEDVAKRLGENRTTVTNYIRLLDLPEEVRTWVAGGQLSMGHARCLLGLKSPSDLTATARKAISDDMSVRALEKLVREKVENREAASKPARPEPQAKRAQIAELEESFRSELGVKVDIAESRRKGSGKITIHYHGLDDFDRIAERLGINLD